MRVRYTLQAQGELEAIYSFLDERNPATALSVKELIEERIRLLAAFPRMGALTDEPAILELSIVEYPYKVYYEIADDAVWIIHIRHTARREWGGE